MTGIGIVNTIYSKRLLNWSIKCSSAINEIVEAYDDHLSVELNTSKKHHGQIEVARLMREHLSDSYFWLEKRDEHLYSGTNTEKVFQRKKFQEYYFFKMCFHRY